VFYESHLRQWAAGTRSLPDLMREPQAQLAQQATATPDAPTRNDGSLSPGTQLLALQLDTLENQRLAWRGELWPGQALEWEIRREDAHDGNADGAAAHTAAEATPVWHSVVRFELPLLGAVSASIRLAGPQLQLCLRTDSDHAAAALRSNGPRLAAALEAAGSTLENLSVVAAPGAR
jgi:flagellar hook-length control protein FliK